MYCRFDVASGAGKFVGERVVGAPVGKRVACPVGKRVARVGTRTCGPVNNVRLL